MDNFSASFNSPDMHFVPKGWGYEKWIVNKNLYCGKLLFFSKGRKCSLHYHKNKDETFYIQSGKIKVYYTDDLERVNRILKNTQNTRLADFLDFVILTKGDNFYVPPFRLHQMEALEDTELFEFSTTHEDEDSYRIVKGD